MSEKPSFLRDWTNVIKSLPMTEGSGQQKSHQARVAEWMLKCFGPAIAADRVERNHRFFEEATELVQAAQMTRSEAHQLVDYVYGRPVGELTQEVGGVMTTLAALCLAHDVDMLGEAETELARINLPENVEKIRAKQAVKPKHSPLPEVAVAGVQPSDADIIETCNTVYTADHQSETFGYEIAIARAILDRFERAPQPSSNPGPLAAETVLAAIDSGEWSIRRFKPDTSLTDEANAAHAWGAERTSVPYCDAAGERMWFGATAIEALNAGRSAIEVSKP